MYSTLAADLGGSISLGADPFDQGLDGSVSDFSLDADTSARVTRDINIVDAGSFETVTTGSDGVVKQSNQSVPIEDSFGDSLTFTSNDLPEIVLHDDMDPSVSLKQSVGDVSFAGRISESGAKTLTVEVGDDTARIASTLSPDGIQSLNGTLADGPVELKGAVNPVTDEVTGSVSISPEIQIDEDMTLTLEGQAAFSSEGETTYRATATFEAEF